MNGIIISVAFWGVLGIALVALIFHRRSIRNKEDETLTLADGELDRRKQLALRRKADQLNVAVKILTTVFVIFGLALSLYWFFRMRP